MIKILLESLTTKYFQFSGRASRKEYWGMYLLDIISCCIVFFIIKNNDIFGLKIIWFSVFLLFLFLLPSITVSIRRLHDINFSGWWFLIIVFPYIWTDNFLNNWISRFIIIHIFDIILGLIPGVLTTNKYGDPPVN